MRGRNAIVALLLFASCASAPCHTLYFGTKKPDRTVVSRDEWQQFVREVLDREFSGMTTWEASGRWKGEDEPTHVVFLLGADREAIARVIAEYRRRFQQESVLDVANRCTPHF